VAILLLYSLINRLVLDDLCVCIIYRMIVQNAYTALDDAEVRLIRPVERVRKGESFPGPRDVWGPRSRSKILKRIFRMASF